MIAVHLSAEHWQAVTRALEASAERGAIGIVADIQRQTGVFPPRRRQELSAQQAAVLKVELWAA